VGVAAVGFGGMAFQTDLPLLPHEGLQQLLYHGLDSLLHLLSYLFAGFVRYRGLLSFRAFSGKATMLPHGHTS